MRKICFVTGSRAEYGLLNRLMKLVKDDPSLELQVVATNMHLSEEFGLTYREIERDGFHINKKVEMLLSSDTANATTKSVGLATIGFADAYEDLKPDIIIVLGDRYEMLAAVSSALFFKIPVAHIHGGEITESAYDDAIRHSITKMSHLHFTATEDSRKRVIQLGENPDRVFNVGSLGLDNIKHIKFLSRKELEKDLNFDFGKRCILVTFHPVTLEKNTSERQMKNLLDALQSFKDLRIIFTLPNSDTNGRVIIKMINEFVSRNQKRAIAIASLGQRRYLSILKFMTAVVGNSSSGIIEVPSFGIPTLNIGNRQKGRVRANSIIDCDPVFADVRDKLKILLSSRVRKEKNLVKNPYYKRDTAFQIIKIVKKANLNAIIIKSFYNL
jgi:UDP-N-acetylglucosamine 2-epimerase (non-hydrolysing)/GDP/UDP-N,N'-diacetylbacillosamine 2-epimerase (hydrolysing)